MEQIVKILFKEHVTHDVLRIVAEKPSILTYTPGQAVDISINKPGWEKEIRSFTFTSLPNDDFIEFTIKTYPSHNGVTAELLSLNIGDELIIYDVFGDIAFKGVGLFIAGGAGITPFLAILKKLEAEHKIEHNKLLFANKTKADIIHEEKFNRLLGANFVNVLSDENISGYEHGFVTAELIKKLTDEHTQFLYLCGPPPMMNAIEKQFISLGISDSQIIKEGF